MNSNDALVVRGISKSFATTRAVDDLSFEVKQGEIFGLLGPNGAGKTTSIRMILDIIKPDAGQIDVLGGPMDEAKKPRIGYLPEERGLYDDMTLMDTLVFFGQLKELPRDVAARRAEEYLRQVKLWDARDQKIEALSRGMKQKAQFVAATLHEPDLIIIDEPLSGLDPVNTRIIKDLLYRMRDRGAAIIMSTHQMHQVEEMCQRILLIDRGQRVLYGSLSDIRRQFARNAVRVEVQGQLDHVDGVEHISRNNGRYRLLLKEGVRPDSLLKALVERPDVTVEAFERVETSLDEIFVQVVQRELEPGELPGQAEGEAP
jgi:ABC-2 type transport system ATP-binding protein